jgi:phage baseplate assembly protein W
MAETVETPMWWNEAWGPYTGVSDMKEVVRQLMKVLILTVPGENPAELDPNFGVGLRNVLFMNDYPGLRTDIEARIRRQINTYIRTGDTGQPMVRLLGVQFSPYPVEDADPKLSVRVSYTILVGTSESDVIEEDIPADSGGPFEDGQLFPPGGRSPGQELFPEREAPGWPSPPMVGGTDGLFGELKWKKGI